MSTATLAWPQTAGAIAAGLGAAASFAGANVLQQQRALRVRSDGRVHPRLLWELARDQAWVAGLLTSAGGFALQALALSLAPITLVQPVIVTELLFALPLAARLAGKPLWLREWTGAALVAGGLAAFLVVAAPEEGTRQPSDAMWLMVGVAVVSSVTVIVSVAPRRHGIARTSALAAAAGISFGLSSALVKSTTEVFADRGLAGFVAWQPYAMGAVAITGLLFVQSAFQAGPLAVSLPLIDVLEPLVAVLIAIAAYGERINHDVGSLAGLAVAAATAVLGVFVLDRSPVVVEAQAAANDVSGPEPAGLPCPSG